MKKTFEYQISFRGTEKEIKQFEKFLIDKSISMDQLQEWDAYNDKDNPPSGILNFSKYRQIKTYIHILDGKADKRKKS